MTGDSPRQLVVEVERVYTVRRRIATFLGYCKECRTTADLVDIRKLSQLFEISPSDAVLQLRGRLMHLQSLGDGVIAVCVDSLLSRSPSRRAMLSKSISPPPPCTSLPISSD
jgi:hypothetical protein